MLRGNLSTRPFYNERLVTIAMALVALVALALAAFNVSELVALVEAAQRRSRPGSQRDRRRSARGSRARPTSLRRTVDPAPRSSRSRARPAKRTTLIDQRTFSWTVFFGLIEKTLPLDVRLVAVSPQAREGRLHGHDDRRRQDRRRSRRRSIDALQEDGTFYDVLPSAFQQNDDGTLQRDDRLRVQPAERRAEAAEAAEGDGEGTAMKIWRRVYEERRRSCCRCWCSCWPTWRSSRSRCCRCAGAWRATKREALDATVKLGQARLENKRAADARVSKEEADKELKKFYADVLPTRSRQLRAARAVLGRARRARIARGVSIEPGRSAGHARQPLAAHLVSSDAARRLPGHPPVPLQPRNGAAVHRRREGRAGAAGQLAAERERPARSGPRRRDVLPRSGSDEAAAASGPRAPAPAHVAGAAGGRGRRAGVVSVRANPGPAATRPAASNPKAGGTNHAPGQGVLPEPVKLADLASEGDAPSAGRNLFRFGVKPHAAAATRRCCRRRRPPPPPPPPPGPPPIKLRCLGHDGAAGRRPRGRAEGSGQRRSVPGA